ncbi:hypothetical protein AVEN_268120-1 [Araneus ventricosus]|uniref:Uncharacterized protein n=1 Tax=Araneus ventricosus TaxID=182803 RepID=A0A4Y2RH82_ARAVE|nr:hypothetical protein AVEN_268120-1 [Araneus ventricosus]
MATLQFGCLLIGHEYPDTDWLKQSRKNDMPDSVCCAPVLCAVRFLLDAPGRNTALQDGDHSVPDEERAILHTLHHSLRWVIHRYSKRLLSGALVRGISL